MAGAEPVEPIVTVADDGVIVESVRLADDRSGDVVVRAYEALGARTATTLRLGFPASRADAVRPPRTPDRPSRAHRPGRHDRAAPVPDRDAALRARITAPPTDLTCAGPFRDGNRLHGSATTWPPARRSDRLVAHEDPPGRCSHSIWDGSRRLVRACVPRAAPTRRCSLPSPSAGRHGTGSCRVQPGVPVPVLSYHGQDAPGAARARRPRELIHSRLPAQSRIVSHPRAICALIESGHRVCTRKPLAKLSRLHSAPAVPVFCVLYQGACG